MAEESDETAKRKDSVQEDRNFTSGKISDLSRYIGFAVIALVFALLTSTSPFSVSLVGQQKTCILIAAFFGVMAILSDYLHYFFGYLSSLSVTKNNDYYYDAGSIAYKLRKLLFWSKQLFGFLSAILVLITILGAAI